MSWTEVKYVRQTSPDKILGVNTKWRVKRFLTKLLTIPEPTRELVQRDVF